MSSDSSTDDSERRITPNCLIPDATGFQETQSEYGTSVVAVSCMSELCPEVYGSVCSSRSFLLRAPSDADQNEDATNYCKTAAPPLTNSPVNAEKDEQLPSVDASEDDKRPIAVQETDPNASSNFVPTEMPVIKAAYDLFEVDGKKLLSGYWNLDTGEEKNKDTLHSETEYDLDCADPTIDDNLPFQMDDDEDHVTGRDQDAAPGAFTTSTSLSFGQSGEPSERPLRPAWPISTDTASNTALNGSETGKSRSNTLTPTKCSPAVLSTSNTSDKTTSSTCSQSAVAADQNHTLKPTQIKKSFKRADICKSIASLTSQTEFVLGQCKMNGIKATFQFHAQGLDEDYMNHNGTVTAVLQFSDLKEMNLMDIDFKLSVNVFKGPIKDNHIIGQSSSIGRLDEDDRQRAKLHMTVHNVVNLQDIIFSKVEKIYIEVLIEPMAST